jgi:hypothetical protein
MTRTRVAPPEEMLRCRGPVLLAVVVSLLLASACRPTAGGDCTLGQAACMDGRSGVFCSASGTYERLSCRGRDGCRQDGAKVSCDQSIAVVGDSCTQPGFACTPDQTSDLACRGGEFVLAERCSGPFACRIAPFDGFAPGGSGSVLCDIDTARPGDPCLEEGDYACTSDKSSALRCAGKRMVVVGACDGPDGCKVVHLKPKGTEVECDTMAADGGSG